MDTLTFWDGQWHEGNPRVIGIKDHAMWLASTVFDGARAFDRCVPDLDRHCQRVITSAERMGLKTKAAFIHLPLDPSQAAEQAQDMASLSAETSAEALRIILAQLARS